MTVELDRNRIAIRQRDFLDVLDLALRVIRTYAGPLTAAFAVGIVPIMLLNAWLLAGLLEEPFETDFPGLYLWYVLVLTVWETPLAMAPAVIYLGQSLFMERPRARKVAANLLTSLPQLLIYQLFLRGLLVLPALLFLPVVLWFLPFALWPYSAEVILLERNPLRQRPTQQMTTYRRTLALHRGTSGDLLARWLGATAVGIMLWASFWVSFWVLGGLLLSEWQWEGAVYSVYFPLALWLTIAYLTVVRFLAYLDLRIRREGWEVELLMRAEQARLARGLA